MSGVTSHDVARLSGVSQATVSRALRGDPRISLETRERIDTAVRKLNYVPSEAGRSLRTRRSHRIAMVTDLNNPLYPVLVTPIHQALAERDYRMTLLAERDEDAEAHRQLFDGSVDGVILTTTRLHSELPLMLQQQNIPQVMLNRTNDIYQPDSVVADNVTAGQELARILIDAGHRQIALLAGPEETSTGRDRERGFRQGLALAGIELRPDWLIRGWFDYRSGVDGLRSLLGTDPPPRAIACVSDTVAIGVINEADARGLSVPDDLAVAGVDNLPTSAWSLCGLSTVALPLEAMSRDASNLLVDRILKRRDGPPEHHVHPVSAVLRRSHLRLT